MSLTIQQILLDSERLAIRLKEDDSAADVLLSETQNVYKQIDAMKQYAEETGELNELARQRPHSVLVAGIQQESRHLRELQQENRELRAALEEHQNALDVIMSKYRQQITHLVQVSKLNLANLYNNQYVQVIKRQSEKMNEMVAVMKTAAEIDEKLATQDKEVLSRLSTENQGLRELLDISVKFGSVKIKTEEEEEKSGKDGDNENVKNEIKKEKDTEEDEDKNEEDSAIEETESNENSIENVTVIEQNNEKGNKKNKNESSSSSVKSPSHSSVNMSHGSSNLSTSVTATIKRNVNASKHQTS